MNRPLTVLILALTAISPSLGVEYTVKQDDSLSRICARVWGNGRLWYTLYLANIDKIRDPDKIRPGLILEIPDNVRKSNNAPHGWRYWKTLKRVRVKAYCPCKKCCYPNHDGRTSTGKSAWNADGIAVNPRLIPYGTMIKVPGARARIADDTGGKIKWLARRGITQIELRMTSHRAALKWGSRRMDVKLYRRVR